MTVKELIKALKKMPQDEEVAWSDHDQSEWEINNIVGCVSLFSPDYAREQAEKVGAKMSGWIQESNIGVILSP